MKTFIFKLIIVLAASFCFACIVTGCRSNTPSDRVISGDIPQMILVCENPETKAKVYRYMDGYTYIYVLVSDGGNNVNIAVH